MGRRTVGGRERIAVGRKGRQLLEGRGDAVGGRGVKLLGRNVGGREGGRLEG